LNPVFWWLADRGQRTYEEFLWKARILDQLWTGLAKAGPPSRLSCLRLQSGHPGAWIADIVSC